MRWPIPCALLLAPCSCGPTRTRAREKKGQLPTRTETGSKCRRYSEPDDEGGGVSENRSRGPMCVIDGNPIDACVDAGFAGVLSAGAGSVE